MTSQLGRMILGSATGSSDEANEKPDEQGRYAPMDGLLDELSERMRADAEGSGDRRPEDRSSTR